MDVATLTANTLANALSNLEPAATFATVRDETLRALTDLLRLFTTSITPAVALLSAATAPTLLVAPSLRVLASPALAPVVTSPALYSSVVLNSTPPLPHLISPEDDNPVPLRRYPLHSRPRPALSGHGPHLISAAADLPPTSHTGPRFVNATRFLLTSEQQRHYESNAVINKITGSSLDYHDLVHGPNKDVWICAFANDLGQLSQGFGTCMSAGTYIVLFVSKSIIPKGSFLTYARLVATIFPRKSEVHRVWCTVGGDKFNFPGVTTTNYDSLNTSKIVINGTLSTPNTHFLTLDIKYFY